LISTGISVWLAEAAQDRGEQRIVLVAHDLRPRGAVHMHHRRNARAPLGPHRAGDRHEMRRVAVHVGDLEHPRRILLQHERRERHELGAVEPLVEIVVDRVVVRARDDRARPSARGPYSIRPV
jgi:hypothetical protein